MKDWLIKKYIAIRYGEVGATAVEYGILVALIAIVIIAAVTLVGLALAGMFNNVASKLGG
ncbi:MAG: Flp family type IVb pilin [Actinobacteria bacterium]|nr:Flp family type IVb pilin [Actinomycetota bacterium]